VIRVSVIAAATVLLVAAIGTGAAAQQSFPGVDNIMSGHQEQTGENRYLFSRDVEMTLGDATLYADLVEIFVDQDRMVATGNVTLVQTTNRISAERAEFNYKTKLGTFWGAVGFATIKPEAPRPGAFAPPPVSGQDTDVYFQGDIVEKIGGRKYKITRGGFTTCVQPTPRWRLTSDTIILNIEHYTFLRNAIFSVKGVPMLYTPIMYYPTKKDDRATGFLIPTLGETTLRGESIHNAFFWVLDRSEDLTFMHDWFSKTGQGLGSEYRYNFGGASNGNLKAYFLNEHNATYSQDDGSTTTVPASHSYEVHGNATQFLPFGIRARGRVDYFSNITQNQ
jgi:lipopolysaccharide assembly outer membrane protein LptD (OstA)